MSAPHVIEPQEYVLKRSVPVDPRGGREEAQWAPMGSILKVLQDPDKTITGPKIQVLEVVECEENEELVGRTISLVTDAASHEGKLAPITNGDPEPEED